MIPVAGGHAQRRNVVDAMQLLRRKRDIERADPLGEEIVRRWGQDGLVAIGLALTTARMYPTLKYALGHGKACSRVTIAGAPAPFHRIEPLAA